MGSKAATPWDNNHVQFARMLAEIGSVVELSVDQWSDLCESTGLTQDDIDEVFDRAQIEFERAKRGEPVRKATPVAELERYQNGHG